MFWLGIELDQQHIDNPEKTHVNVEICSVRKMVILLFFLAMPHSMQDLSSPTRDQTHAPCSGNRILTTGPSSMPKKDG